MIAQNSGKPFQRIIQFNFVDILLGLNARIVGAFGASLCCLGVYAAW